MSLLTVLGISSAGMDVQNARMEVSAQNLTNANSTRTPEGGPYQRKEAIITSTPVPFDEALGVQIDKKNIQEAKISSIVNSNRPPKLIFDPQHPDADDKGFVATPDINVTQEMVDVMSASKAYESNVTVFNTTKQMLLRTLDLGGV